MSWIIYQVSSHRQKDEDDGGAHSHETTQANVSVEQGLIAGFLVCVPRFEWDYRKIKRSPRISSDASLFKVESACRCLILALS